MGLKICQLLYGVVYQTEALIKSEFPKEKQMQSFICIFQKKINNFGFVDKTNYKINTDKPELTNTSLIYVRPGSNITAPFFFWNPCWLFLNPSGSWVHFRTFLQFQLNFFNMNFHASIFYVNVIVIRIYFVFPHAF